MRLLLIAIAAAGLLCAQSHKTENVVLVMTDGLRVQEVFEGAEEILISKEYGQVSDVPGLKARYWRATPEERRAALLPFVWGVMAKHGQVIGNPKLGNDVYVTNGMNFSYPGYSETLTGFGDPRIDSNDKNYNPNVTVFEWLHAKPAFKGKVAAFGAWDTFGHIFNQPRAKFPVVSGYEPLAVPPMTPVIRMLNKLNAETPYDTGEAWDSITFNLAMEYLKIHKPRLLFISLGETDEFAHAGKYPEYLRAANRVDGYLKELWDTMQAMPEYKGKTTLIFSPDHGRGKAPVDWKGHGQKVPDSKYIWMSFLGPDIPAMGERSNVKATQSQIAATIAALLGEDYNAAQPKAGKPVDGVISRSPARAKP